MTRSHGPTGAAEFLALDLPDAFVCQSARAGAAGTTGLDGIGAQVVCQPLQITVTDKWVLCQVTGGQRGQRNKVSEVGRRRKDEIRSRLKVKEAFIHLDVRLSPETVETNRYIRSTAV